MLSSQRLWPSACSFCVAFTASSPLSSLHEIGQIVVDQITDMVELKVAMRILGQDLRIDGVVALARKHGGDPVTPDLLHRVEDAQLVIDHDVMPGWIQPLDVVQFLLL